MALKKGDEYIASLKSLGLEANVMGKKTQDLPDHPLVTPSVRAVASTFDCAYRDETRDLFRVAVFLIRGRDQSFYPFAPKPRRPDQKGDDAEVLWKHNGLLFPTMCWPGCSQCGVQCHL